MNDAKSPSRHLKVAITVVTVVKDNEIGLEKTLKSLLSQNFQSWQSIIVDGGSLDGSRNLAASFVGKDLRFILIDQKSTGIYEAMNLGLSRAQGKYLWFLNSGDVFASKDSLGKAIEIVNSKSPDLLVGGYSYDEEADTKVYLKRIKWIRPWELAMNRRGLCHQSMVYNKIALMRVGGYDPSFLLASDFHSALKISISGKVFRTNLVLSKIELGGVSQTKLTQVLHEKQEVRKSVFGMGSPFILLGYFWTLALKIKLRLTKSG